MREFACSELLIVVFRADVTLLGYIIISLLGNYCIPEVLVSRGLVVVAVVIFYSHNIDQM